MLELFSAGLFSSNPELPLILDHPAQLTIPSAVVARGFGN
jgi:hypothetical protein